jgi:glycyl-tRNA synthetase
LYDYGPSGSAIKTNLEKLWRDHFVLEEDMLEITGTCLTPECVLKTSGHVDKFEDFMVKDKKKGTHYRIDKLIEDVIDKKLAKKKGKMKEEEK